MRRAIFDFLQIIFPLLLCNLGYSIGSEFHDGIVGILVASVFYFPISVPLIFLGISAAMITNTDKSKYRSIAIIIYFSRLVVGFFIACIFGYHYGTGYDGLLRVLGIIHLTSAVVMSYFFIKVKPKSVFFLIPYWLGCLYWDFLFIVQP